MISPRSLAWHRSRRVLAPARDLWVVLLASGCRKDRPRARFLEPSAGAADSGQTRFSAAWRCEKCRCNVRGFTDAAPRACWHSAGGAGATQHMPTFIDSHPTTAISRSALVAMVSEGRRHVTDRHGVRSLRRWIGDGKIHCILSAPDPAAVARHHADHRLQSEDLRLLVPSEEAWPESVPAPPSSDSLWPGTAP